MQAHRMKNVIPPWVQRLFPIPQHNEEDQEPSQFAWHFYLLFLAAIILSSLFIPIFFYAGRSVDAMLCIFFALFSAVLLRILHRTDVENVAKAILWGAYVALIIGLWNSDLGIYNPVLGVLFLMLIFAAFFTPSS